MIEFLKSNIIPIAAFFISLATFLLHLQISGETVPKSNVFNQMAFLLTS